MQQIALGPVRAITFDVYGALLALAASFAPGFDRLTQTRKRSKKPKKIDTAIGLARLGRWAGLDLSSCRTSRL